MANDSAFQSTDSTDLHFDGNNHGDVLFGPSGKFAAPTTLAGFVLESFAAFVMYSTLHLLAVWFFRSSGVVSSETLKQLSRKNRILMSEKVASSVNALIMGLFGIYMMFVQNSFKTNVFTEYPPLLDHLLCNFVGYTIYDVITMAYAGSHWTMWLHHGVCLYAAIGIMYWRQGAFWNALFTVTELTALAHNMVWYIQYVGGERPQNRGKRIVHKPSTSAADKKDAMSEDCDKDDAPTATKSEIPSRLLTTFLVLRALSFLVFRSWIAPYAIYHPIRVSGGWTPFLRDFLELPIGVMVGIPIVLGSMSLLNTVWTVVICKIAAKAVIQRWRVHSVQHAKEE
ncbi:hypothetical protein HK102_013025 [Quaeritorhiza haematococci]|nr:hypothetical protein HK102_013025 [Quaeritorhiza haematococci]